MSKYEIHDLDILIGEKSLGRDEYNLKILKIGMNEGNHTTLIGKIEIKKEYMDKYYLNRFIQLEARRGSGKAQYNYKSVEIILGERTYFSGYITNIEIIQENSHGLIIDITGISKSIQTDKVKRYKAYQEIYMTYKSLIQDVFSKYENDILYVESRKLEEKIEEVIIQYQETDWEFANRVLSKLGLGVFCGGLGEIILGHERNPGREVKCLYEHSMSEQVDFNGNPSWKLWCYESFVIGDNITINGEYLGDISQGEIEYVDGRFKGQYLIRRGDYRYPYISNFNIKGNSVQCEVVEVPKNGVNGIAVMKVDFSRGLKKTAFGRTKSYCESEGDNDYIKNKGHLPYYPYATFYSKSNTGYFCTPEVGDTVSMYFPFDEETSGCVQWALNNEGNGRFSNPEKRNYTIKEESNALNEGEKSNQNNAFQFKINLDSYELYAKREINVVTENEMIFNSHNSIVTNSKNQLAFNVEKSMQITGDEMISNFNNVQENVSEEKVEVIDELKGIYMNKLTIEAQEKLVKVSGKYLLEAELISEDVK